MVQSIVVTVQPLVSIASVVVGVQGPRGPAGIDGSDGATGPAGSDGAAGAPGSDGSNGADGNRILAGTTAPPDDLGADGDFYVNSATGDVWSHGGSVGWNYGFSIIGPQGPQGIQGTQGIQGITGDTGATGPQGPAGSSATGGIDVLVDGAIVQSLAPGLEFSASQFATSVNSDGSVNLTLSASVLKSNVSANLTAGYTASGYNAGTKSSGTYTPDPANGGLQYAVNGGAHTLAPPSTGGGNAVSVVVQYTNNGSAGAVTTSGFSKVDGSFTTTNGHDFMCYMTVINGFSHLNIVALQ